ncbi:MAG: hypothetical protein ABUL67_00195 [Haliangium ochraceum]
MADSPTSRPRPLAGSPDGKRAPTPRKGNRLVKVALALAALAGLGFLFIRSARDTRSAPYTIGAADLRDWVLALEPASGPTAPLLVLRPPGRLASGLFHQIFTRAMESLNAPAAPAIPLLLRGEFDKAFAGRVTPDALLAAARGAGLDAAAFKPACLAYRRSSDAHATQQLYFALFESPAFSRFREQMGVLRNASPSERADFDPASLSPLLFVAAAETMFNDWLPLRADPKTDCVAPIVISSST